MFLYKTKRGYYYKRYKNGKSRRISRKKFILKGGAVIDNPGNSNIAEAPNIILQRARQQAILLRRNRQRWNNWLSDYLEDQGGWDVQQTINQIYSNVLDRLQGRNFYQGNRLGVVNQTLRELGRMEI